jgi:MYXO-CTERM domain-containing protein
MMRGVVFGAVVALAPATAFAETVCGTVDEFNAAMAAAGTSSPDVTLTYDVVGVNPADFFNTKGSLAQFRNTTCATGQDAGIKVYGTSEPLNESHPPGTLKLEYGNSCCAGDCSENWADPNPSAVIFVDGTETCNVRMFMSPTEVGYSLMCNTGQFDAVGENPEGNAVNQIALLEYLLEDGGTTWELPNATASNDEVCWESVPTDMMSITVPVSEDVTTGPSWGDTVFEDVGDLAVEAADNEAYLKFDVPAFQGTVTNVRLFMHTRSESSSEGDGGEVHLVASNDWSEGTLTWNTKPAYDAASLGRIGPASVDVPVSLDLGVPFQAAGTHSFAVVSPATDGNGTHFFSKEGSQANAPYLIVEYEMSEGGESSGGLEPSSSGGASEESGGGSEASGGGSSGVDSTLGPGLPGAGRGGETGCACNSARGSSDGWLFALIVLAATGRSSRRRACRRRP